MITDLAIDQALIELKRTEKALLDLRAQRRSEQRYCPIRVCPDHLKKMPNETDFCPNCQGRMATSVSGPALHAAAKRASMDLTRKLAALRAGR